MFESLEDRRMLSATATLRNGLLTVRATDKADVISINNVSARKINVSVATGLKVFTKDFNSKSVRALKLIAGGGNDQIFLTVLNAKVKVTLDCGKGDDLVNGSNGPSTYVGGPGRDILNAGSGKNVFNLKDGQVDSADGNAGDKVKKDRNDNVSLD